MEKKGFTLIELLAVIVVLGIVAVIGAVTVLPYLENARKEAVITEANNVREAAVSAMSLITLNNGNIVKCEGSNTNCHYTQSGNTYCFTLAQLVNLGVWTKSANDLGSGKYEGRVKVTVPSTGSYTYETYLTSGRYIVYGNGTLTSTGNVYSSTDAAKTAANNNQNLNFANCQ